MGVIYFRQLIVVLRSKDRPYRPTASLHGGDQLCPVADLLSPLRLALTGCLGHLIVRSALINPCYLNSLHAIDSSALNPIFSDSISSYNNMSQRPIQTIENECLDPKKLYRLLEHIYGPDDGENTFRVEVGRLDTRTCCEY